MNVLPNPKINQQAYPPYVLHCIKLPTRAIWTLKVFSSKIKAYDWIRIKKSAISTLTNRNDTFVNYNLWFLQNRPLLRDNITQWVLSTRIYSTKWIKQNSNPTPSQDPYDQIWLVVFTKMRLSFTVQLRGTKRSLE